MASRKNLTTAAATQTASMFTGKESETGETTNKASKKEKAVKVEKQVFSFRGEKENVKAWRLYATVTGIKVDDLGSLALQEYIKNHPLKGAEKALFDEKINK